jgi:hypothetical protein
MTASTTRRRTRATIQQHAGTARAINQTSRAERAHGTGSARARRDSPPCARSGPRDLEEGLRGRQERRDERNAGRRAQPRPGDQQPPWRVGARSKPHDGEEEPKRPRPGEGIDKVDPPRGHGQNGRQARSRRGRPRQPRRAAPRPPAPRRDHITAASSSTARTASTGSTTRATTETSKHRQASGRSRVARSAMPQAIRARGHVVMLLGQISRCAP